MKSYRNADIQQRIQNLQLSNDPQSWREYPSKGCSCPDLKNGAAIAKTDQDKLKQFAEQLKSVFATKIELKNKNLEREI